MGSSVVRMPAPRGGAPAPVTTPPVWPISGDVPDIEDIIDDQALTIQAQANLIAAYQSVLQAAQNPPPGAPATTTASVMTTAGTSMAVTGTSGVIVANATVTFTGNTLTTPLIILGQISGIPGSDGTYFMNQPVSFAVATALTVTPPPPLSSWPPPTDAPTLEIIREDQTAILRMQSSLIQNYQQLLNDSQTTPPATGP